MGILILYIKKLDKFLYNLCGMMYGLCFMMTIEFYYISSEFGGSK